MALPGYGYFVPVRICAQCYDGFISVKNQIDFCHIFDEQHSTLSESPLKARSNSDDRLKRKSSAAKQAKRGSQRSSCNFELMENENNNIARPIECNVTDAQIKSALINVLRLDLLFIERRDIEILQRKTVVLNKAPAMIVPSGDSQGSFKRVFTDLMFVFARDICSYQRC